MTSSDWKTYKKTDKEREEDLAHQTCRSAAIQYAAGRVRSSGQVRTKLLDQDFPPYIIENVISELEDEHYLHDHKIALFVLSERRNGKAESHMALQQRLNRLGVRSEIIQDVLDEHISDRILCREFLENKVMPLALQYQELIDYEDKQKVLAKIVRKASSRGFYHDLALNILFELMGDGA